MHWQVTLDMLNKKQYSGVQLKRQALQFFHIYLTRHLLIPGVIYLVAVFVRLSVIKIQELTNTGTLYRAYYR